MADIDKAKALAMKIEQKVVDLLTPLQREMDIMMWPPDVRVILWDAVAAEAKRRAAACRVPGQ